MQIYIQFVRINKLWREKIILFFTKISKRVIFKNLGQYGRRSWALLVEGWA
jgi:hypothetical protein